MSSNHAVAENPGQETLQARPALTRLRSPQSLAVENFECFIGISSHVAELKQFVTVQAASHHPVLLTGERGLRQEQIARALHQAGKQRADPFVSVNVHSLSAESLNELLFGPQGLIGICREGTIYVNELAGLPPLLQQRFAVHFEELQWRKQAVAQPRLILATEFNPAHLCAENRIAYGLIEMLRPWSFHLKPLRERSEDIPYLANLLVERVTGRCRKGPHEITPATMQMLSEYSWESNIDELEAVLESAINRTPPHEIEAELLPARIRHAALRSIPPNGINLPQLVNDFELTLIDTALQQTSGNQVKAAKLLGLRVQTLNMKLKRFGKQPRQIRP